MTGLAPLLYLIVTISLKKGWGGNVGRLSKPLKNPAEKFFSLDILCEKLVEGVKGEIVTVLLVEIGR